MKGTPTIVAARPGVGKSAMARTICRNVARTGAGVHVFSLEDSYTMYFDRLLAEDMGVSLKQLWAGQVDGRTAAHRLPGTWEIDDRTGLTAKKIRDSAREHAAELGTKLVVVDYVQLVRSDTKGQADHSVIADAMAEFTGMARELDAAVVVVSQLLRAADQRDTKRPSATDLKGSGALEETAKAVLLLYRPRMNRDNDQEMCLVLEKHNSAEAGVEILLGWDGPRTRVYNLP